MAPRPRALSMMAAARAAPSTGSVPAPSSSSRIRELSSASFKMPTMVVMWEEKVDRDWAMDCSSPMSASTRLKTRTVESAPAGMCRPHWAMRVSRPMVFRVTVLPPVLGPVIIRVSNLSPSSRSLATAFFLSSRGCRALWSRRYLSDSRGLPASMFRDSLPRAKMVSSQMSRS